MKQTPPQDPEKTPEELFSFVEGIKRRWMQTVDAISDPLMIVSDDFVIGKANKAISGICALDIKDIVGQKCYKIFANRTTPCPECSILNEPKGFETKSFNIEGVRGERFYEVSSNAILDDQGLKEGTLQIYRDRTDAKRLQNQLLQTEKLASIGLLAGGIAHEINNPLGGILIFSQMLLREMDKNSSHFPDVVEIEAAALRCKAIIESLLSFARQAPGGYQVTLERVSLKDAALQALRFGKIGGHCRDIDIEEDFAEDDIAILGNHNQMMQVFLNLIKNAFQAMPSGGVLTLRSSHRRIAPEQNFAVFEVIDTGIGIPAQDLKRIFDPFFTSKGVGEGTGLGLSICYGIVEDLGGTIEVSSVLNEGSCFRIIIPEYAKAAEVIP